MKRLLKNITVYLIATIIVSTIILWTCILLFPEKFLGDAVEYAMWDFQKKQINKKYDGNINAIIGDSRGMASLNPSLMTSNYYNFSLGGATFFEGYKTIQKLIQTNKIDTLILCYGIFHFENSDVFRERTIPFHFINKEDIAEVKSLELNYNRSIENINPSKPGIHINLLRQLKLYRFPLLYRSTFIENAITNDVTKADKHIKELSINRGHALFGIADSSNGVAMETLHSDFTLNPVILNYLDSIHNLVVNKNIKCFIIVPPLNETTYKKCTKEYLESFEKALKLKMNNFPEIKLLPVTLYYPNNMFGDPSHLNKKGSDYFTRFVYDKITEAKTAQSHHAGTFIDRINN